MKSKRGRIRAFHLLYLPAGENKKGAACEFHKPRPIQGQGQSAIVPAGTSSIFALSWRNSMTFSCTNCW